MQFAIWIWCDLCAGWALDLASPFASEHCSLCYLVDHSSTRYLPQFPSCCTKIKKRAVCRFEAYCPPFSILRSFQGLHGLGSDPTLAVFNDRCASRFCLLFTHSCVYSYIKKTYLVHLFVSVIYKQNIGKYRPINVTVCFYLQRGLIIFWSKARKLQLPVAGSIFNSNRMARVTVLYYSRFLYANEDWDYELKTYCKNVLSFYCTDYVLSIASNFRIFQDFRTTLLWEWRGTTSITWLRETKESR